MKKLITKLSVKDEECKMNNIVYCICDIINKLVIDSK